MGWEVHRLDEGYRRRRHQALYKTLGSEAGFAIWWQQRDSICTGGRYTTTVTCALLAQKSKAQKQSQKQTPHPGLERSKRTTRPRSAGVKKTHGVKADFAFGGFGRRAVFDRRQAVDVKTGLVCARSTAPRMTELPTRALVMSQGVAREYIGEAGAWGLSWGH